MRQKLSIRNGHRLRFRATFGYRGTQPRRSGYGGEKPMLLFRNVIETESGVRVSTRLWLNATQGFAAAALETGDLVEFDARVVKYPRGYGVVAEFPAPASWKLGLDYWLSHPTRIEKTEAKP